MDTGPLKQYAIQARRDFVEAVSQRAAKLGITSSGIQDYEKRGDLLFLGTEVLPGSFEPALKQLRAEVSLFGFDQMIDQVAYTWFNRLVALRFMEVNGLLPIRVLSSSTENPYPDVLREFAKLSLLINFDPRHAQKLYEAGGKDEELYEYLLTANCNELYRAMPFLFEKVSDSSEILLPDGLLSSDSIVRKLVEEIPEESWLGGVEIIGWLYQFYISEKKDEVIGSVVKSQDIPAATQLFTPNWIVKYLIQNSLGAYWLSANPDSPLKKRMDYYIEPARQTPDVETQLNRITPNDIDPETITVLDPAVGSGHILVEAYNLLYDIYLERGYRAVDVPRLILEKNLFGLDIDKRASQLAGFALLMRAAKDDNSVLDPELPPKLNVLEIVEPEFKTEEAVQFLMKGKSVKIKQLNMPYAKAAAQTELPLEAPDELSPRNLADFIDTFRDAKTFGSLIRVPMHLTGRFHGIESVIKEGLRSEDLFERRYAEKVLRLVAQARIYTTAFDVVVANPPYMGAKFYNPALKKFIESDFKESKADLCAAFVVRGLEYLKEAGRMSAITIPNWMFLSSFEQFRRSVFDTAIITAFVHNGRGVWGSDFGSCSFSIRKICLPSYIGRYKKLFDVQGSVASNEELIERFQDRGCYECSIDGLYLVPGVPVAYWLTDRMREVFREGTPLGQIAEPKQGLATADNNRFLRRWYEVDIDKVGFGMRNREEAQVSLKKWFPYNKGGEFRKWYGNLEWVVNWENDGSEIRSFVDADGKVRSRPQNTDYFFKPGVTWTFISSSKFGVRIADAGSVFDVAGSTIFPDPEYIPVILSLLLSPITWESLRALNPTLNFQVGNIFSIPVLENQVRLVADAVRANCDTAIRIAKNDWNSTPTSWDFQAPPILIVPIKKPSVAESLIAYDQHCLNQIEELQALEVKNNQLFIDAYGLTGELTPDVSKAEITLHDPNRVEEIEDLISYAVGCMLGRYSLDEPGIVYALSANLRFDLSKYRSFPADLDGILPVLDHPWFEDDTTTRFVQFIKICWGAETLRDNLTLIANSLDPKADERPENTIRRYFSDSFFKSHLKTYKKRPIYWLFKSGKEQAFQCLVYLHRYNESTLSTMRTEYVLPLQARMVSEEKRLENDIESASSVPEKTSLRKKLQQLHRQQAELQQFDEKLHHYADQRIRLELDDGVKVNYGKFGDLLSDVRSITGGGEE